MVTATVVDFPMMLSVIIPVLNEAEVIIPTLERLQLLRRRGHEVIVVDGGSEDNTVELCQPLVDHVYKSEPGRARQMNTGARKSHGDVLWFLHADTLIESDYDVLIINLLSQDKYKWGRFNVHLSGSQFMLRFIERLMNLRSRLSGIATGDQGIFVRRKSFEQLGGFAPLPIMEDIDISKRLKKLCRACHIQQPLITSSRRWEQSGIVRTILLMWRLRFLYALGVDTRRLAQLYR